MKKLFNLNYNICDNVLKDCLEVHFYNKCDNKCIFCIDSKYMKNNKEETFNKEKILKSILDVADNNKHITFSGGEPLLKLEELLYIVKEIKEKTRLTIEVITSLPKICYEKLDIFLELLNTIDLLRVSALHYDNHKRSLLTQNFEDGSYREKIYEKIKEKNLNYFVSISLNLVKGILDTKKEVMKNIFYFDKFRFKEIRINELSNCPNLYVSFEDIFNVNLPSPYAYGCLVLYNFEQNLNIFTPIIIKRRCFMVEPSRKASINDLLKALYKRYILKFKKIYPTVIYEDGLVSIGFKK